MAGSSSVDVGVRAFGRARWAIHPGCACALRGARSRHEWNTDWLCQSLYRRSGPHVTAGCAAGTRGSRSNIYVDHGLTGTNRARPGLREALAAVREGDTLAVTKLDRLARSVRDAREIADELTTKGVALSFGGSRYDPTDPVGRLLFNVLAMVAEFERDLISTRTKEGMAVARAKGHLKGKQPKLSATQRKLLFDVQDQGEYTQTEIAELFNVSRATVYRELQRRRVVFLAACEAHIF